MRDFNLLYFHVDFSGLRITTRVASNSHLVAAVLHVLDVLSLGGDAEWICKDFLNSLDEVWVERDVIFSPWSKRTVYAEEYPVSLDVCGIRSIAEFVDGYVCGDVVEGFGKDVLVDGRFTVIVESGHCAKRVILEVGALSSNERRRRWSDVPLKIDDFVLESASSDGMIGEEGRESDFSVSIVPELVEGRPAVGELLYWDPFIVWIFIVLGEDKGGCIMGVCV